MFKKIVIHETLLNLISFRFHVIVMLFVIIFFGGLFVNIDNYQTRLSEYNEIMAMDDSFRIAIPPNPLVAFAYGVDQYSSVAVVMDDIGRGKIQVKALGQNNVFVRLSAFESLDFNFAIRVLLSLGAILITFASVSGERFVGTLKLVSVSSVLKKHIILAKLIASFICMALPLLVCTIISCVILTINNMLITSADVARISLFLLFSLIYILFFLLVGLVISIATRRPQESLVIGVLFWLLFVFVLPALTSQASKLFADLPSARAMEEVRTQRWVATIFQHEHSRGYSWLDERFAQMQADNEADWERARNQFVNYAKFKRRLDLISPTDIYNNVSMEIVGNGVENAFHSKNTILKHKTNILKHPNSYFDFKRKKFIDDFMSTITSIFVLCLEICVLLIFAYKNFMYLDLREG